LPATSRLTGWHGFRYDLEYPRESAQQFAGYSPAQLQSLAAEMLAHLARGKRMNRYCESSPPRRKEDAARRGL